MIKGIKQINTKQVRIISVLVLVICFIGLAVLVWGVRPNVSSNENIALGNTMSILAAVLGIFVGGCTAGFFAISYKNAGPNEKNIITFIAYLFITAIFLFTFLSIYCLVKIGAFIDIDFWAAALLFTGIYVFLNGIVLLERWDSTLIKSK